MYKVFIENRAIIFVDKNNVDSTNRHTIASDKIVSIEKDLLPVILLEDIKSEVFILCEDPELEIQRLFSDYEKITAAGGIVRRKNEFLFIKRNGFWDIPKGKMEEMDESIEDAAIREVAEECGIKCSEIQGIIAVTYHTYSYEGIPTLKKTYWFSMLYEGKKSLKPQLEEGITKAKWLKMADLDTVRKNTFASILEVMAIYFEEISEK
jgi:8-oxo-dGTP pyrophosphatase MutT (NUDIX family)